MKKFMITLFFSSSLLGYAQENISYQKPSKEILELADFSRPPTVLMDSKRETMVLLFRPTYKTLEDLNKEGMKIAGLRIDPQTNISSTVSYVNNLKIKNIHDKDAKQISGLPEKPLLANFSLSPDEKFLGFTNTTENGVELWVVELEKAQASKVTKDNLNANLGTPFIWLADSQSFLIQVLPKNRPSLKDDKNDIPKGPTVATGTGEVSQNRTYQDLIKTPLDEENFETLVTSELKKITLNRVSSDFAEAAMFLSTSLSPNGKYVLISKIEKPFSYIVPYHRFPHKTTVHDLQGNLIKTVNEVPLNEILPKGFSSVRKGKRNMNWRPDKPASLYFVEALDDGDQAKEADYRDQVFLWDFPFDSKPKALIKTSNRYGGIQWANEENAFLNEYWYDTRNIKTHWFNPTTGESKLLTDRNFQDIYNDPGNFYTNKNEYGKNVVQISDNKALLIGNGFTAEGQFPFIDELNLENLEKNRLYTISAEERKEDIIDVLDMEKGEVLIMKQSPTEYPNFFLRNIQKDQSKAVTHFENPFKSLENVYKELISYKREDGVNLTGTLYLPADYDRNSKEKLPLLIWAYPTEYKDKATAGMSSKNVNSFTYPSYGSFIYWVTKGYAVLDDAAFPIIGEDETEPNDTFIEQLIANAKAAIDAVDELGYIDRKRVGVGGHSYGAFMTANLLTHSDLFACGIARSGAYNRTLTPFGFQSEQRNYWDAPEVYNKMSPFMNAPKMKTPMLLVHGEQDNNMGTYTMQTERYFEALKNLGAPVRMVLLPKESHGYEAKENVLHLLYEQDVFLEKHLKN